MKRGGGAVKRKSGAGPNGSAPLQIARMTRDADPRNWDGTRTEIRVPFDIAVKTGTPENRIVRGAW